MEQPQDSVTVSSKIATSKAVAGVIGSVAIVVPDRLLVIRFFLPATEKMVQ